MYFDNIETNNYLLLQFILAQNENNLCWHTEGFKVKERSKREKGGVPFFQYVIISRTWNFFRGINEKNILKYIAQTLAAITYSFSPKYVNFVVKLMAKAVSKPVLIIGFV